MVNAYYNDVDKKCCAWISNLMDRGLITPGKIDDRPIEQLTPDDVRGFTRVHFFAGIAGWDYALNIAGWGDRSVWTGSCPCQPFSAAGKRKGQDDERHVWPEFFRLIRECGPNAVFGEQVEGAVGHGWLDGVFADLEGESYTCGAVVLGAHSVGAPHIRQRLYWVADAQRRPAERHRHELAGAAFGVQGEARQRQRLWDDAGDGGTDSGVRNALHAGPQGHGRPGELTVSQGREGAERYSASPVCASGVSNAAGLQSRQSRDSGSTQVAGIQSWRDIGGRSFWRNFDILPFIDGKARRVESGTFPLVDGIPRGVVPSCDISESYAQATSEARVMRLKGYGNAIVPAVAAEFILAFMECSE